MRQNVANRIVGYNTRYEGRRYHMYSDVKGLVTTAIGNLLADASAATALPFTHGTGGGAAGSGDKSAGWQTIKDSTPGLPSSESAKDYYGGLCDLRLDDAAIDVLAMQKAVAFDGDLKLQFSTTSQTPSYADYADFCADAQVGLLSMEWPGSFNKFVKFKDHVRAGNWFAAAKECFFDETNNKGLRGRNEANRWQFSLAGRVNAMGLDPAVLYLDNPGANKVYFVKGGQYLRYDWNTHVVDVFPSPLSGWKLTPDALSGVDAVVSGWGARKTPHYFGKTYFFKGSTYQRFDWDSNKIDVFGLPLSDWGLTGGFEDGIDAAINGQGPNLGKLYFFKGDQYCRFDWATNKMDKKPASIFSGWALPGAFASKVDAIVSGEGPKDGSIYFFNGSDCVRFRWEKYKQVGQIEPISTAFPGLAALGWTSGISAAFNAPGKP